MLRKKRVLCGNVKYVDKDHKQPPFNFYIEVN